MRVSLKQHLVWYVHEAVINYETAYIKVMASRPTDTKPIREIRKTKHFVHIRAMQKAMPQMGVTLNNLRHYGVQCKMQIYWFISFKNSSECKYPAWYGRMCLIGWLGSSRHPTVTTENITNRLPSSTTRLRHTFGQIATNVNATWPEWLEWTPGTKTSKHTATQHTLKSITRYRNNWSRVK